MPRSDCQEGLAAMTLTSLKEKRIFKAGGVKNTSKNKEVMAFCPGCKALQTVWINGNSLMQTRKFSQIGNRVYHNCNSTQPCQLYHIR